MFINEVRVSSSELEADILAADILNREEIELCNNIIISLLMIHILYKSLISRQHLVVFLD